MGWLSRPLTDRPLGAFFLLTFVISWGIWLPVQLVLAEQGELHPLNLIGGFGPFVSAVIVRSAAGRGSLLFWLRRIFVWRTVLIWIIAGWILMPVVVGLLHHVLYLLFGGESGGSGEMTWLGFVVVAPMAALLLGGNEEPGWRGFALPAMLERQLQSRRASSSGSSGAPGTCHC